ncbi:Nitrogen regulation protein NtrX [hydrothermal vent metagenome]|uniref:Nitrogen regulation protein NtrX n=1 Tax=hydrothermal vent metagenome TaxID=652676 RepID=A0A3B0ZRI0_9ZZZZ
MSRAHILVVDDEEGIRDTVKEILEDEGYEVTLAENGDTARRARQMRRADLILLDIWMPDVDGITLLKEWSEEGEIETPVIMISGHGTVETAVEATRLGAYEFLEKPLSLARLLLTIQRALEADKLKTENKGLREHVVDLPETLFKSAGMRMLKGQIDRIAKTDAWVLVRGEAGTGKQTCARYLHEQSARSSGLFINVGVGSLTKENAAVELFGREEGETLHYGRLERANGGTLFFDEIADMNMDIQTKLLGALQSSTFLRVGGSEPVPFNVRIIAATQYDLVKMVESNRLRQDLYYKISVVPINVPPLRERKEDVPDLLSFYVNSFVQSDRLPFRKFSVGAQNRLRNYVWPGNIRELKNLVQRLLILGSDPNIEFSEVEAALGSPSELSKNKAVIIPKSHFEMPLRQAREQFEKTYFEHLIKESGGAITQVAKAAGVERTHLYRKLKSLGINPKD